MEPDLIDVGGRFEFEVRWKKFGNIEAYELYRIGEKKIKKIDVLKIIMMEEIKKKTEEIIREIDLYIIDNLNVGYEIKTEMLKKIIRYCEGPEN